MSEWLIALILSIVEGLTEFLPVSSTGHLILVNQFASFGDEAFSKTFDMFIQVGAIISVLIYFWKKLWVFKKEDDQVLLNKEKVSIWLKTIVGVIPALILGFLFKDFIEEYLLKPIVVAWSLIIGGIILLFVEKQFTRPNINHINSLPYSKALYIGFFQCLAMIPGVSRSASSIIGGMALGLNRVVAAEFSFFLAIPTLVAASGYFLLKHALGFNLHQFALLGFGFIASFIVAYAVIAVFMKYIKTNNFVPFGYYRIILGVVIIVYSYLSTSI
ncbi:MAG TPA: undecaprenyl-diphosphate phosphatase [Saprospiraceae bacterium]|nr:undecaprenyl-diphosphate phosphatase [Saprospiraceae bacterium]